MNVGLTESDETQGQGANRGFCGAVGGSFSGFASFFGGFHRSCFFDNFTASGATASGSRFAASHCCTAALGGTTGCQAFTQAGASTTAAGIGLARRSGSAASGSGIANGSGCRAVRSTCTTACVPTAAAISFRTGGSTAIGCCTTTTTTQAGAGTAASGCVVLLAGKGDRADCQNSGNAESDESVHLWVSNKRNVSQFAAIPARHAGP